MNKAGKIISDVKSANFFGHIYRTYDHDRLVEQFGILDSDKVLDIGGGHNPFKRADYIIDIDMADGTHRNGQEIPREFQDKYISADIHQLPFADKSIDFVFCSHVMEHVSRPRAACMELMRVGKRGYIETPRKWVEIFAGYPSHQWLVDVVDGEIVFEKRRFIESPYLNTLLISVWGSKTLEERAVKQFLNMSCVQFAWEGEFRFRVVDEDANEFDYSNPRHAALSHFYFARNIFLSGVALDRGMFHAIKAVALWPDVEIFRLLRAAYSLILDSREFREESFKVLMDKKVFGRKEAFLLKLGFKEKAVGRIRKVLEDDVHIQ